MKLHTLRVHIDEIFLVGLYKGKGPVYIDDKDKSMFGKAMRTLLITELEKENIEISLSEKNAYKLDWSCQKIHHNAPRNDKPGFIEWLFIDAPKAILFGGDTNGGRPHCEILLTFKLHDNGEYIMRKSKLLYITDQDEAQYQSIPDVQNKNGHSKLAQEVTYEVKSN